MEVYDGLNGSELGAVSRIKARMNPYKSPLANYLYNFPCRKLFGFMFATLGGSFALAFLIKSLLIWEAIPDGVNITIGILTGGFGAYVASSSYEAVRNHDE